MTSNMPAEEPGTGVSHTLFSLFQSDSNRLRPDVLIHGVSSVLLGAYTGVQNAARYINHSPRPEPPASESFIPNLQRGLSPQTTLTDTDLERGSMLEIILRNDHHHHHLTSDADEADSTGRPAAVSDHGSSETPLVHPARTSVWVVTLVVGLLVLIMVPGLIVGMVTRQVAWGIAISGAFAPAVVFFGGLYYHHNK